MIIVLYIFIVVLINLGHQGHYVVDSWNKALDTHLDGFSMFFAYFVVVFILQCLQDIQSKLNDLEKKIDNRS